MAGKRAVKHEALREALLKRMKDFKPGDRFLSVREIMEEFSVSQATVDKTLSFLYAERLLDKIPGRGIFISNSIRKASLGERLIGLELPDWPSEHFKEILQSLRASAPAFGMRIIPIYHDYDDFQFELPSNLDAMIWLSSDAFLEEASRRRLENLGMPLIMPCKPEVGISVDYVGADSAYGGSLAAKHLIDLGHKSIAVLVSESALKVRDRVRGFRQCCQLLGVECREIDCQTNPGEHSNRKAYEKIKSLIADGALDFTGMMVVSDESAAGAMSAIHEVGLSIPGDISVVGFGAVAAGAFYAPPLTSVSNVYGKTAKALLEVLKRKIDSGDTLPRVNMDIEPEITIRKSTAPPPKRG